MSGVTKPGHDAIYYFNIYDTKTGDVTKFEREGIFLKHTIFDYKVDPSDTKTFYFTLYNQTEALVAKVNLFKGKCEKLSTTTGVTSEPSDFYINES